MRIAVAALPVLLGACSAVDQAVTPIIGKNTSDPDVRLERLFEVDGCTVYRFLQKDKYVYVTTCPSRPEK